LWVQRLQRRTESAAVLAELTVVAMAMLAVAVVEVEALVVAMLLVIYSQFPTSAIIVSV
jgi:hypothetical protein